MRSRPWPWLSCVLLLACGDAQSSSSTSNDSIGDVETTAAADGDDSGDVSSSGTSVGGDRYHPEGFAAADVHGPAMKLHVEDCRACHGADLLGGSAGVDCDSCHTAGWRTECVFCHGGTIDSTGAPPRDIDGNTETSMLSFIAHPRHVSQFQHSPYDCTQCHRKPTDVLSEGHIFDDTDARAEVDFSAGLSPQAVWDGNGGCATLYCHGNGLVANGSYTHDQATPSCGGCHPFPGTENVAYAAMSGQHARHIGEGINCSECHDPLAIESHVDGNKNVKIGTAGFSYDQASETCSGLCHLKSHSEHW